MDGRVGGSGGGRGVKKIKKNQKTLHLLTARDERGDGLCQCCLVHHIKACQLGNAFDVAEGLFAWIHGEGSAQY